MNNHWIFTEEHEMFRKSFRKFVDKEVKPHVLAWEEQGEVPRSFFKRMGDLGYLGIKVPEQYGGLGLDYVTEAVLVEELNKCGSAGAAAAIGAHMGIAMTPILNFGSEEQKQVYVRSAVHGEKIAALGITEPNTGSDVASLSTIARKEGENYVLTGSKTFITNGVNADYVVVAAKMLDKPVHRNISLFIVDTDRSGFHVGKRLDKLGWRGSDTADLYLDEVVVPKENIIGEEDEGFSYIMQNFQWERIMMALSAVAQAEMAFESAKKYTQERIQFEKPLTGFQVVRHKLVDMSVDLEKARHMAYKALYYIQQGEDATTEATMAKAYAGEMVNRVTDEAVQLHGGAGYMMEYDVQRYWRDARIQSIGGGTTQIMNEILAKRLQVVE